MVPNQMRYPGCATLRALRAIEFKAFERKSGKHRNGTNGLAWQNVARNSHADSHAARTYGESL